MGPRWIDLTHPTCRPLSCLSAGPNGSTQPNVAVSERFMALFGSLEGPISDGEPALHLWSRWVGVVRVEVGWWPVTTARLASQLERLARRRAADY